MSRPLRVGPRGSPLAPRQTEIVLDSLRSAHPAAAFEIVTIRTAGDRSRASLSEIGGRGGFVVALERALLPGGTAIAGPPRRRPPGPRPCPAASRREAPRDPLTPRDALRRDDLPPGARVGTGSPRR